MRLPEVFMSRPAWFALLAGILGAGFLACGGKVEEQSLESNAGSHADASSHGGMTGDGGSSTGGQGGHTAGAGGAGVGGTNLGGAGPGGWGGWPGNPNCEVGADDSCSLCAVSLCCDAFLACDSNPVCKSILDCGTQCAAEQDAGFDTYAACLDACAASAGYPPDISLLNDWYSCVCLNSCKGPCEYFKMCP
jgi:hypothetical protein